MLTWFALGFGFYLQWVVGTAFRESWTSCRKKKRKEEGMFTVCQGSSWDSCTSCLLHLTSQLGKWPLYIWKCVQMMCASPLPGLHHFRWTGKREVQELEGMTGDMEWQGPPLLLSQL